MPLEINEIGISIRVTGDAPQSHGYGHGRTESLQDLEESRDELVEECIRRVLLALKLERER